MIELIQRNIYVGVFMKLLYKGIAVLTALLIIIPLIIIKVTAATEINITGYNLDDQDTRTTFQNLFTGGNKNIVVTGSNNYEGYLYLEFDSNTIVEWKANTPSVDLYLIGAGTPAPDNLTFRLTGGRINTLNVENSFNPATVGVITVDGDSLIVGEAVNRSNVDIIIDPDAGVGGTRVTGGANGIISLSDITTTPLTTTALTTAPAPIPAPEVGEIKTADIPVLRGGYIASPQYADPIVEITDNTPFEQNGKSYAGTVDIVSVDSDTPQEIPKEVFINGQRYLVGETIYIVGREEKKIEATADTGFSYIFTAVENVDNPVKFTVEGLPEGLVMSEDGVITTKTLPAPVGTFEITVTADNGADTNIYTMTIEIKSEMTDAELLKKLTENDIPELLTEPQEDVRRMWVNQELSIHYEPDIDDFYAVFLDGQLLNKQDYRVEEGSTVIILTEQTIAPLPNGDHVVTTMFHQESNVGLDTVINDVGSSSYVFRFGDEKSDNKRININGDGVVGSVTFDDKNAKETPITTISANTEAIEQRAKNLSNATGCEIIAAFETKQNGGFGGKTATFAVSTESLDLKLKNGTAVYIAVYDSKTGKTYQNKGTVKDGMIVFKTKHSGVFMVSLRKY
jgi:hypothetical protein